MNRPHALAEAFGVTLQDDLRAFLEGDPAPRRLVLEGGFVRGTFSCDFRAEELTDIEALAELQWIDEGDTLADEWKETFGDLVPLAALTDAEADEDAEPYKGFLAVDAGQEGAPVFLFDYDGWYCYLLAESFEAFLAGRAPKGGLRREKVKTSIADRKHLGTPYTKISWQTA